MNDSGPDIEIHISGSFYNFYTFAVQHIDRNRPNQISKLYLVPVDLMTFLSKQAYIINHVYLFSLPFLGTVLNVTKLKLLYTLPELPACPYSKIFLPNYMYFRLCAVQEMALLLKYTLFRMILFQVELQVNQVDMSHNAARSNQSKFPANHDLKGQYHFVIS